MLNAKIEAKLKNPDVTRLLDRRVQETCGSHGATTTPSHASNQGTDPFVGVWWVHDSLMEIKANMTGIIHSNCGGAVCDEVDRLTLVHSSDGKRMTATITGVSFADNNGRPIPNPGPGETPRVGDSSYFQFVAPHLMKETIIRSSLPVIDQTIGNPYWCEDGFPAPKNDPCGA